MAIRKYKPTTPGRRGSSVADFAEITRSTPEKSLLRPLSKTGGRNNQGRMRWKGVRPTVRGVAMNPVDHPHGGGEGKTSGGRHPVSPWGQAEGRTRHANKESDKYIVRRRNAGKKRK